MDGSRVTKDRARRLRRKMTLPEVLLWNALKGGQLRGLRFRKQHPVGPYILDFYCHEARLAVEVDGDNHSFGDRPAQDARRDAWFAAAGIRTLRLSAKCVLAEVGDATRTIEAYVDSQDTPRQGELRQSR